MLPSSPLGALSDNLSSSCPWVSVLSGHVFFSFLFLFFSSSVNFSQLDDEQNDLPRVSQDTSSWGELFQRKPKQIHSGKPQRTIRGARDAPAPSQGVQTLTHSRAWTRVPVTSTWFEQRQVLKLIPSSECFSWFLGWSFLGPRGKTGKNSPPTGQTEDKKPECHYSSSHLASLAVYRMFSFPGT